VQDQLPELVQYAIAYNTDCIMGCGSLDRFEANLRGVEPIDRVSGTALVVVGTMQKMLSTGQVRRGKTVQA
jgi:hypothetical protein